MADEEKAKYPEHKTTGGCLRVYDTPDCCIKWWNELSCSEKEIIKNTPNFDSDKFFEITGIKV